MKTLKPIFIILVIIMITASFSSCRNKEYHEHSKIVLIDETSENSENIIPSQTDSAVTASENPTAATAHTGNVYYTNSGKHYHYSNPCGRGTYFECTLEEAESKGLTPCDKCVK